MPADNSSNTNKFLSGAIKILTYREEKDKEGFVLTGADETKQKSFEADKNKQGQSVKTGLKKPLRTRRTRSDGKEEKVPVIDPLHLDELLVDPQLKVNKEYIREIYTLPKNKDIIVREFIIALEPSVQAFAVFMEGLTDRGTINQDVLKPLMVLSRLEEKVNVLDLAKFIKERILYGNQVDILEKYSQIVDSINYGGTAVFIDGSPKCIIVETKGWDKRSIGKPENEQVIKGPHEAFNETLRSNTGLIRKAIRNHNLITEMLKAGSRNKTDIAIMYLKDVANPKIVQEVKRRIDSIKTDYLGESGILEQFIEDHPLMASPQVMSTERPDRVASFIIEGKVAILIDNNPNVLIVPTSFFTLMHSAEDYYLRMPYGNMLRFLRLIAIFIALMTPGIYISITNFHQEMIPTELILSIAASREAVPFPAIIEIFIMELAFELIREAGVRVPGVIGNTLGIVGALILGQAAVQAGIVSPILIIIVAVTGLASFAIPNYSISFAFRGVRFIFTALAAVFGFFGVSAGLFLLLNSIASMKSFGVPLLSPIGPRTKAGPDIVLRGPVWSMEERPDYLETLDRDKQPDVSRGWVKKHNRGKDKGDGNG